MPLLKYRERPRVTAKLCVTALALALFPVILPVDEPDGEAAKLAMVSALDRIPVDLVHRRSSAPREKA